MIVTYNITGTIDITLTDEEKFQLDQKKTESCKKFYLEEVLENRLYNLELASSNEFNEHINFDNLYVESDWDKHAKKCKELIQDPKIDPYGSPLGIYVEDIPITELEELESTLHEISKRKFNKKKR